jgi:RimJ/RimL family protein N-acetyltransferase
VNVEVNELGQQVGPSVPGWRPRPVPTRASLAGGLRGGSCRLEPLDAAAHAEPLFAADALDVAGSSWTYLPYGPFPNLPTYRAWLEEVSAQADPMFLAVVDTAEWPGRAVGVASYLRIQPDAGSIEVGHLHFSPLLQRRTAATEAQYLLMRHVFADLGYRRYEWKCDVLNAPSRAAAERLGFTYEGTFRQAAVVRGRNRDTAWFSVVDGEWPRLRAGFEAWLDRDNWPNGSAGRPLRSLAACRGAGQ